MIQWREGEKEKDSIYIQRIMTDNFDTSPPFAILSHMPPDMEHPVLLWMIERLVD
jgi:hypothetical protein